VFGAYPADAKATSERPASGYEARQSARLASARGRLTRIEAPADVLETKEESLVSPPRKGTDRAFAKGEPGDSSSAIGRVTRVESPAGANSCKVAESHDGAPPSDGASPCVDSALLCVGWVAWRLAFEAECRPFESDRAYSSFPPCGHQLADGFPVTISSWMRRAE
jgi:hypothetical protein